LNINFNKQGCFGGVSWNADASFLHQRITILQYCTVSGPFFLDAKQRTTIVRRSASIGERKKARKKDELIHDLILHSWLCCLLASPYY
jgi:hypothetical protein